MKTAILTGSEGQLGTEVSEKLLHLGYKVIGLDLIDSVNKNIDFYKVDLRNFSELENTIESIQDDVQVLINNAGVSVFSPFEERTEKDLDFVIDTNLKSNIYITKLVFNKFFKPNNYGSIINIGSIYGIASGDMSLYNEGDRRTPEIYGATKAAIINLTKYFAAYMAENNVRVNCISPGGIFNNQSEEFVKKYSMKVPLKRMANVSELMSAFAFLLSEDSSYVTGQNIIVDGGFTIL